MSWFDPGHPATALAALAIGLLAGLLVPRMVALVPEPDPDPEAAPDAAPKLLYVDLAARRGLAWQAAVATGLASAVIGASVGWHWPLLVLLPAVPVCVALGYIDWHTRLLPSRLLLPAHAVLLALGVVAALVSADLDALLRAVIAMLVVRSIFWMLWWIRSAGMGFGDVRLSALLAFGLGYLGWAEVVIGIYAGFVVFVAPGIVVALVRRDRGFLKSRIPFGPFMVIGALVGIATGPWIAGSLGY
ncbi:prepilin peptidase [Nocardioides marmoriginsengisoli]|uniref:Prepilin peptidase n=1 Tax=Nocardioides marmoriginsengisoli TaxID=661483 RepID=A0A3N0CL93_9ACTN|nr:A24 family peptidase [Nocardioides marmoriginsengisoli]RNL64119.1 prepilin peptidase [Nocardioides marmoriginsengisoli]